MGRSPEVPQVTRELIVSLSKDGNSCRQIAGIVGMTDRTVRLILAKRHSTGEVEIGVRSGRPWKTSERDDWHLKVLSLSDRFKTSTKLQSEVEADSGVRLSCRTVRRRLHSFGLRGCIAIKEPFISKKIKIKN